MNAQVHDDPTLTLCLQLPGVTPEAGGQTTPCVIALAAPVQSAVAELMTTLGIPGSVRVEIAALDGAVASHRPLRVTVDGRPLRYPPEILLQAYSYVHDRTLDSAATPSAIAAWVREECAAAGAAAGSAFVAFVCESCLEILRRQPSCLLGLPQADAYLRALAGRTSAPNGQRHAAEEWRPVLSRVLDLGISIADHAVVAPLLADAASDERAEELIDARRSDVIEVHVPRAFLRELSSTWEAEGPTMFPFLRDGMFVELGLEYPPLRFVVADDLRANSFALAINALRHLPLHTVAADECLVNDTAERLRLDKIDARAAVNPATLQPGSIIDLPAEPDIRTRGLTTWNQVQYVVLCVAELLRQHGWRTVHRGGVRNLLAKFESIFPTLLSTVRAHVSDDQITALIRTLIRERVPVRNLRGVFEGLLDYVLEAQTSVTDTTGDAVGEGLLAAARVALGSEIAAKAARSSNALVVYLIDPAIEQILTGPRDHESDQDGERILGALRAEMSHLPATAQMPHLLTFSDSRRQLQQLVALEHPRLLVVAHEELPPGVNVMPIARIQLSAQ
jgi:hypothetical protein